MLENTKKEIAALRKMNVPELRQRHIELFGEAYRSLTAIARAITGSHWNGYHFFGLARNPRKDKEDAA